MIEQRTIKRRDLMAAMGKGVLAAAVGGAVGPARQSYGRLGPSEKVIVALIGCGGMGSHHLGNLLKRKDVEVAAVCDVYTPRYEAAAKRVGGQCQGYQDYRRILDRKDIDAIWVATPDHWHALMMIHGCQAWKDVYVEKPLTTSIAEGRKMVETARRYGRVVQVGIQQRSMEVFRKAIDIIHGGRLGYISTVRTWIGPNGSVGYETPGEPPAGLNWDLWLGPAPWVPFSPQRFGGFRAFDDYAGGELTNWGPHLVDIARWGIREEYPLNVQAVGNSYDGLTPSDHRFLEVVWEFNSATITWSQAYQEEHAHKSYGMMFQGSAGKLTMDRQSFIVTPAALGIPETFQPGEFFITVEDHHTNFIECIRTRQRPHADVEIGHLSTSTCLMGNIAIDCRRRLAWDGRMERFIGDEAANRHLFRPYRAPWHL